MKLEDVPLAPSSTPQLEAAKRLTFVVALREAFLKPNQTTMDFLQEVRRLSDADKLYLHQVMCESGMDVEPPTTSVPK